MEPTARDFKQFGDTGCARVFIQAHGRAGGGLPLARGFPVGEYPISTVGKPNYSLAWKYMSRFNRINNIY